LHDLADGAGAALRRARRRAGSPVVLLAGALAILGCVAVYNATFHLAHPLWFVGRQVVWTAAAYLCLALVLSLPASAIPRILPAAAFMAYAGLWAVLHWGVRIHGMRGWFAWHGVFLQPSELAKPAFVLVLTAAVHRLAGKRGWTTPVFAAITGVFGLWLVPIMLEPDYGAVLVYAGTFAALLWCSRGPARKMLIAAALGAVIAAIAMAPHRYVIQRFTGFLNPSAAPLSAGWHVAQFQRALASGGLFGRWWGRGLWTQAYLPLAHSDSVFAAVAEAVGLVGTIPLILLIPAWVWYAWRKASRINDLFRGQFTGRHLHHGRTRGSSRRPLGAAPPHSRKFGLT